MPNPAKRLAQEVRARFRAGAGKEPKGYLTLKAGPLLANARRRGIPTDINAAYLFEVWQEQGGLCALSGRPMSLVGDRDACSVDRIEGPLGYIRGNVRLVTWQANNCKGHWTDADFYEFCQSVVDRKK